VANESTDINPFLTMLRLPAAIVMLPAFPVLSVSAVMPVGTVDDVPSIDSTPATFTLISPPLPVPKVSVVIWPLGPIDNEPAVMLMFPAFPVIPGLSGTGRAVMPVIAPAAGVARSEGAAGDLTVTIFKLPALTVTLPALPLLIELALLEEMPVNWVAEVPSIDNVPATPTETFLEFPDPNVPPEISPLVTIDKSPAVTVMLSAFFAPGRKVVARIPVVVDKDPEPFIDSLPATWTLTSPPAPTDRRRGNLPGVDER
jgi:hypothetical protein